MTTAIPQLPGIKKAKAAIGSVEREFLPAALEITLMPPSPLGRAMAWTIYAFGFLSLILASVGRIDIVAVSIGKIVTQARTQVIQAPEAGVVKSILVELGQRVQRGKPLFNLTPLRSKRRSLMLGKTSFKRALMKFVCTILLDQIKLKIFQAYQI